MRNTYLYDDPSLAYKDLKPLLDVIYEGFEAGTEHAREYFESQNRGIEPTLASALVRYKMKAYLSDRGQVVEEYDQEDLANIGLCIRAGKYCIRLWKSGGDAIPPPGTSRSKRSFLYQQLEFVFPDQPGLPRVTELNLVVLWNVDPGYRLRGLHLVCPKAAPTSYSAVEVHWAIPIDHPALSINSVDSIESIDGQMDDRNESYVDNDLPFEPYEPEKGDIEQAT